MIDRVVLESRHKFVYYDSESIEVLKKFEDEYSACVDCEVPIVVYIRDFGLPKLDTKYVLSKDIIKIIHEHYYQLLIFSAIINKLCNEINEEQLNSMLRRVFKLCSYMGKEKIENINTLRKLLDDSKNMYVDLYLEYMKTGQTDYYDKIPISFVMIDNVVMDLKEAIGLKKYFCLMLELDGDLSVYNQMAVDSYIASRCNGYLSVNVLLSDEDDWKYYYASNGQFIQETHDYTEIDLRNNKDKIRIRHN